MDIVLNQYQKNNDFKKAYLEQIFNQKISFVLDNDARRMRQSMAKAELLRQTAPGVKLTRQIRSMAAALTGTAPKGTTGWKKWLAGDWS